MIETNTLIILAQNGGSGYEDIELWDWHRILIGDNPTIFMFEVFIRTVLIFFSLLVTLRLMGKRMGGQLTLSEMAVMVTLGAIIAVPMQIYDRGILLGATALIIALIFQRGFNYFGVINPKFENITQGEVSLLIKDGELEEKQLEKARISINQLYAVLRNAKITHLTQVRRLYLEASGKFTLYKDPGAKLPEEKGILPEKATLEPHY